MNNLGLWQYVIYAVIIFGGAIVKWIGTRLKEQNERKKLDESVMSSREESLRTGRTVSAGGSNQSEPVSATLSSPSDPQARLRELAMQRQEQLRKLRERGQLAGAGGSVAVPAPAMSRPAPSGQLWPGGPPVTGRPASPSASPGPSRIPNPSPMAPRPVAMPMSPPRPSKREVDGQRERAAEARKRQQQQALVRKNQSESERERAIGDQNRRTAAARIAGTGATEERFESDPTAREARWGVKRENATSAGWTTSRLRDAFVLSEVIGPPVAMRE